MRGWKGVVLSAVGRLGYTLVRKDAPLDNIDDGFARVSAGLGAFSMTSRERLHALYQAICHVEREGIPGAIVECGVWRGGSIMLACRTLLALGSREREVCLFDTFEGMTEPEDDDVDPEGRPARELLARAAPSGDASSIWCVASQDEVRANVLGTGYPAARCRFIAGRVEDTLPAQAPERIALLRLDTDWYASTRHELEHLVPRLAEGGVLIIDDYGHWRGARRAVDEYFAARRPRPLLHRIDGTARIGVVSRKHP